MTTTSTTLCHEEICGLLGVDIAPETLPELLGELGNLRTAASEAVFHGTIRGPGQPAIVASVIELEDIEDRDQG